jgi:hypothetical protein
MANAFVFPLGILAILLVIFLAVRSFIPLEMDLWRFLSSVFLCLITYGGILVLFKKQLLKDILSAL